MLRESGEHPVLLREAVTSPGGTTIAAIRTMEDHGVRAAMLAAIEAARDRSRELAPAADSRRADSRRPGHLLRRLSR
jgi:pyrroline-5-carboxylate reductase